MPNHTERAEGDSNDLNAHHNFEVNERKNKIEALLRLADTSWRAMDTRRTYEWKANFGLWTAVGLLAGFLFQSKAVALSGHPKMAILLGFLVSLGIGLTYIFMWSKGLYGKNQRHPRRASHYWFLAEKELGIDPQFVDMPGPDTDPFWKNWSVGSQVLITSVFIVVVDAALLLNSLRPLPK